MSRVDFFSSPFEERESMQLIKINLLKRHFLSYLLEDVEPCSATLFVFALALGVSFRDLFAETSAPPSTSGDLNLFRFDFSCCSALCFVPGVTTTLATPLAVGFAGLVTRPFAGLLFWDRLGVERPLRLTANQKVL